MDILGKAYVIEHCIGFFQKKQKEKAYRIYVTDALKAMVDNTAKAFGGMTIKRYADLFEVEEKYEKKEARTSQEIVSSIRDKISKMGG